ncbi:MAG: ABC transporter ATP-binding protein [Armatimonadetes bacterium]|nr:ABC transporter ATP-binding protein [Armatimonadota bacterium]
MKPEKTSAPERNGAGLEVLNLHVSAGDRQVLFGVDMRVPIGETHVMFGPNGAGKTTLLSALLGLPQARVLSGDIRWNGQSLLGLDVTQRSQQGVGMAFQRPPAIAGLTLRRLAHLIAKRSMSTQLRREPTDDEVDERVESLAQELDVVDLLDRNVNEGFSGGEMKRSEVFQIALQNPRLVLLDEPESGVDIVNIERIGYMLRRLLQRDKKPTERTVSAVIITHSGHILNYVNADMAHVLFNGVIICRGNPRDVFEHVHAHGFQGCVQCSVCNSDLSEATRVVEEE